MRLYRAAGIRLLIALSLTACVPPGVTRSPAEAAAAQQADTLSRQGQFEQAAQAYLALAAESPGSRDHYRLLAAETYRQEGKLDQVESLLAQVKRQHLRDDEPVRHDLLQAELALRRHDAKTALQLTTQPTVAIPPALQLRLLELRARAMQASDDVWGAARTRVEMDTQLSGLDQSQNRRQVLTLLTKLGVAPLKQRATGMQPGDRMLPWINEALTKLGVAVARPQPNLEQPVGTMLPGADANVREGYQVPQQLALLLPAGKNYAAASMAVQQGFFAAYVDAAHNHAPRPSIRVYDSGGSAESAVKAYRQAVGDGAQLVVGPLTRTEVAGIFTQAQLPVPLLALNHPDDKSLPTNGTSEFGLLPETEGAQAADHLIERGLRHAYVIVSSEDFAQRAASAFKAEFEARGGTLAGTSRLEAKVVNYSAAIGDLHADSAAGDAGVFISMRPQQARLLLPQLKIAHINLPVVATSHVYAGVDDAGADNDLNGVEFCDSPWLFDAQPGLPNHGEIAAQLPTARGASARLFAFGMDAWNLVPYIGWLRDHPGSYLPGASGQLTADQFGRVRRVLVWAKFDSGLARPLGGSLQIDDVPANAAPASTESAPASALPTGATPAAPG